MQHVYVGDKNTLIRHMFTEAIPAGSTAIFKVKKPDGTVVDYPANITPGSGAYANYVEMTMPEFDQAGIWHFQVHVTTPNWEGYADARQVEVLELFT